MSDLEPGFSYQAPGLTSPFSALKPVFHSCQHPKVHETNVTSGSGFSGLQKMLRLDRGIAGNGMILTGVLSGSAIKDMQGLLNALWMSSVKLCLRITAGL